MSGPKRPEDEFFEGEAGPRPAEAVPRLPPPRRRESPLFARSPAFAVLILAIAGWLLWSLWPDASFFFSSREPLDLGGAGAYRLDAARANRLVQVRGELVDTVSITAGKGGDPRTVGRLAGTSLLVDRPGKAGPPIYEGRLLPPAATAEYAEVVAVMRRRGAPLGERVLVLRDGERPWKRPLPVVGTVLLLALVAINLRALVKSLAA